MSESGPEERPDTAADRDPELKQTVDPIREYWDARLLGVQYVGDASPERCTPEYFEHIRPWMNDDESFGAGWANGVRHATGDTARAIREVRRVLRSGGRAIISHFYRKPSWMYTVSRLGRENIEHQDEDPPVNEFYTDAEKLALRYAHELSVTAVKPQPQGA